MTFLNMLRNVRGATAIEYGLIAALIAVAGIAAFTSVGTGVKKTFDGEHPCCLCKKIEQARQQEHQQQPNKPLPPSDDFVKRLGESFFFAETHVPEPLRLDPLHPHARREGREELTPVTRGHHARIEHHDAPAIAL